MGAKGSKEMLAVAPSSANDTEGKKQERGATGRTNLLEEQPSNYQDKRPGDLGAKGSGRLKREDADRPKTSIEEYGEFRDDLLAFSLGEAAHDYARRLLKENPSSPALLALFGETSWLYEKVKNPVRREHWVDRMEVFMEGIDATRKCIRENPDYAPCHRVYTLLAAKAAEQSYWFRVLQPFGVIENWKRVMNRGHRALELDQSTDVYMAMGQLSARAASNTKKPFTPYSWYARYHGLPQWRTLMEEARDLHLKVVEREPKNLQNACRLGMIYLELGDDESARRWYSKVRDELTPADQSEDIYQTIAHTHLTTHLGKKENTWNLPFG